MIVVVVIDNNTLGPFFLSFYGCIISIEKLSQPPELLASCSCKRLAPALVHVSSIAVALYDSGSHRYAEPVVLARG